MSCLNRTYFPKTENGKHCSKIIFKYVNSIVEPIFNEKMIESVIYETRKQYTDILFTVDLVKKCG